MVDWIAEHKRCALWAGMGLGKSSGTLFALDMLHLQGNLTGPTLVIGPMRKLTNT